MEHTSHTRAPREVLAVEVMRVMFAADPHQALREAATNLAPLMLCGQLTEDQITDPLAQAAHDRGIDGDDAATIIYACTIALFN